MFCLCVKLNLHGLPHDFDSFWMSFKHNIAKPLELGFKVNNQLVAYVTRFLAVHLKNNLWSHHCALKAKVQCDFSSAGNEVDAYSPQTILTYFDWYI